MDYKELLIPRKVINLQAMSVVNTPDVIPIKVRGINAVDLTNLLGEYSEELGLIFDTIEGLKNPTEAEIQKVLVQVLSKAPDLIADAIVMVTDFELPRDVVTRMSLTHQMELIAGVIEITVISNGGLKKLQEVVLSVVQKIGLQNHQKV